MVFLAGVALLSLKVQRFNDISGKRFSVDVATKSFVHYFELNGRGRGEIRRHSAHDRKPRNRNSSSSYGDVKGVRSIWVVSGSMGVIVREHANLSSRVVGELSSGSLAIGDSTPLFLSTSTSHGESSRLFITYPVLGWVSVDTFAQFGHENRLQLRHLLRPLSLIKTVVSAAPDQSCSSENFLAFTDFRGGDIENIEQPLFLSSAIDCCNVCSGMDGCSAFTFTPDGLCWLKDKSVAQSPSSENLVSGFMKKRDSDSLSIKSHRIRNTFVGSDRISASCCTTNMNYTGPLFGQLKSLKNKSESDSELSKFTITDIETHSPFHTAQSSSSKLENSSPFTLRIKRIQADWTAQWPVGTGKFGALVGGTIAREVVPLSIGGLFIIKKEEDIVVKDIIGDETKNPYSQAFKLSRDLLSKRDIVGAENAMGGIQQPGLGMFQYVADFTLLFAASPLHVKPVPKQPPQQQQRNPATDALRREPGLLRVRPQSEFFLQSQPDSLGRYVLLDNMNRLFETRDVRGRSSNADTADKRMNGEQNYPRHSRQRVEETGGFGTIHLSDGVLDMRNGLAYSFFVEKIASTVEEGSAQEASENSDTGEKPENEGENEGEEEADHSGFRVHHREWFASEIDNVLVGTMSCENVDRNSNSNGMKGSHADNNYSSSSQHIVGMSDCLNVALRLTRDHGPNIPVPHTSIKINLIEDGTAFNREIGVVESSGSGSEEGTVDSFAMQMVLKAGDGLNMPTVIACGVITCTSASGQTPPSAARGGPSSEGEGEGEGEGDMGSEYMDIGGSLVGVRHTSRISPENEGTLVPAVTCNRASSLEIITSIVESGTAHYVSPK